MHHASLPLERREPFALAKAVMEACELAIARGQPTKERRNPLNWLCSWFLPMEMAVAAARPGVKAFAVWCALLLGGAIFAYGLLRPAAWFPASDIDGWFLAWAYLTTICFVLGKPSVTAFPGWISSDVTAAERRCPLLLTMNERDIADVRFFVVLAEAASRRRIVALWWVTGSVWAVSAWMAQKGLETTSGHMLGLALIPFVFCLFFAGLVASYTRAVSHVYGLSYALLLGRQRRLSEGQEAKGVRQARGYTRRGPRLH